MNEMKMPKNYWRAHMAQCRCECIATFFFRSHESVVVGREDFESANLCTSGISNALTSYQHP